MNQPHRTPLQQPEPSSPIHRAFWEDYQRMEEQLRVSEEKIRGLLTQNMSLVSEVSMLRDAVERSDKDRMRLQAVASTFGGQARSLSAIFSDILALAIKNGIEAAEMHRPDPEMEQAAEEAQDIIRRLPDRQEREMAPRPLASPRAPQAIGGGMPEIDWRRLPQG